MKNSVLQLSVTINYNQSVTIMTIPMYALCRLYGNSHFVLLFSLVRDALKLLTTNAHIRALYLLLTFIDYSWCLYMLLRWKLFYVWQDQVKSNCLLGSRNLYTAISCIFEDFCCMRRGSIRHPPPVWEIWTYSHSICCMASHYLSHRGVDSGQITTVALKVKGQDHLSVTFRVQHNTYS